jgi:hypothetical protein
MAPQDGMKSVMMWLATGANLLAQVPPLVYRTDFTSTPSEWAVFGDASLFKWDSQNAVLNVTWNSARPNSYFYRPLGFVLTDRDDFSLSFTLILDEVAIGTSAGKPYTFEVSVGLLRLADATHATMFRGSGINSEHGPRNAIEFDYFPDSGFGATVAPTMITQRNEIVFGSNFPVELTSGNTYAVRLHFDSASRTLSTTMLENGLPYPAAGLKPALLPANYAGFFLDAIAVESYSDEGQTASFAGSIHAVGRIDDVELTVLHRPRLHITRAGSMIRVEFPTEAGWTYYLESSRDLRTWERQPGEISGGNLARVDMPVSTGAQSYRLAGMRRD